MLESVSVVLMLEMFSMYFINSCVDVGVVFQVFHPCVDVCYDRVCRL